MWWWKKSAGILLEGWSSYVFTVTLDTCRFIYSCVLTIHVNNFHYSIVVWVKPCVFARLRTRMKMSLTLKRYGFMRSSSPSSCSVNITQHMPCLSSQKPDYIPAYFCLTSCDSISVNIFSIIFYTFLITLGTYR